MKTGWNLPDGVTPKMIDDLCGPEIEVTYDDQDKAYDEICAIIKWEEGETKAELMNALDYLNTKEGWEAYELLDACDRANPAMVIDHQLRNAIISQAEDWIDERAEEIARERDVDDYDDYRF